jgi:hypothetical protein
VQQCRTTLRRKQKHIIFSFICAFCFMILSFLVAILCFSITPVYATPRLTPPTQKTLPWVGHFSAKNFKKTRTDRLRLSFVKRQIRKTILALPAWHTDALDKLEIRNESNISRGLSTSKKIILHTNSIDTTDELQSVFIHELGHIVDLGALTGKRGTRTRFQDGNIPILSDDPSVKFYGISWSSAKTLKTNTQQSDFVSGYAKTDCFEDFAESYLFYRLHGEKFRALAKNSTALQKKYIFIKTFVFSDIEFGTEKEELSVAYLFDTTLLPIEPLQTLAKR